MAASETRSSARVSPRSVMRVAAISVTTSSIVAAVRLDPAGAGHVADGAEAHSRVERLLARQPLDEVGDGVEHPVAPEHLALVREVDRRQLELLPRDVLPDVELGPVRDREDADVLALADPRRCRGSRARAAARAGSTDRTSSRKLKIRSFARARSSSRRAPPIAASNRCSSIASSSVVVWSWLREARGPVCSTTRPRSIESWTLATTSRSPSSATRRSRYSITSGKLCPVSTCITGNGKLAGPERLLREPEQHDRVLAAREEQHRPLALGGDLAHDVDRLGLELVEMGKGARDRRARSYRDPSGSSRPSSASLARTAAADSSGVRPSVSSRARGRAGSS